MRYHVRFIPCRPGIPRTVEIARTSSGLSLVRLRSAPPSVTEADGRPRQISSSLHTLTKPHGTYPKGLAAEFAVSMRAGAAVQDTGIIDASIWTLLRFGARRPHHSCYRAQVKERCLLGKMFVSEFLGRVS